VYFIERKARPRKKKEFQARHNRGVITEEIKRSIRGGTGEWRAKGQGNLWRGAKIPLLGQGPSSGKKGILARKETDGPGKEKRSLAATW